MNGDDLFRRYQELQSYVGWTPADAERVRAAAPFLDKQFGLLADDFYQEIEKHPDARKTITGGAQQIERLKGTLCGWLQELVSGQYDCTYVTRRWRVGWRHVEIGLDQVYTNVALSRLRTGLVKTLQDNWHGDLETFRQTVRSLDKLLDLDLAIIQDAYQTEYAGRLQRSERQRGEATFAALVEAAPCLIVILRPDHSLAYFSPFAAEVTGFPAAAVLGQDFLGQFLAPADRKDFAEHIRQVLCGKLTVSFENQVIGKDGLPRWTIWNVRQLSDYGGGPAILAVGQDITPVKQAQEKILQTERLAAIGQMVAGLAHESGNALARSRACLDLLASEVSDRSEAVPLILRIQQSQDHLQQLYEEVRGYAAPLKLERDWWNLTALWRQAWLNLDILRQGRETHLLEHTGGLDLTCLVDPFRLQQVFRNIMENSLAACPGPVTVEIRCRESALDGGPALEVALGDNGPGLNPEQRQRIFEPFFTTKSKGTGLGMAIVKRIVEAHGGQIAVGPNTGAGAEILITLPRETSY